MPKSVIRSRLLASTILIGAACSPFASQAFAQTTPASDAGIPSGTEEIVVTGSRIKQTPSESTAPVTMVSPQDLSDRGYVQAGDVLNTITANTPQTPTAAGSASPAGNGQQYPNLFNLGAGRTLTLVNGYRMASTSIGLGDEEVNTNLIPVGLIDRVDIVQAGGAAVYGSDAIAGVVNYILKSNYQGFDVDFQGGESTYGDYPKFSARLTYGRNFDDNKGNFAVDFEWNKTGYLLDGSRPITQPIVRATEANPFYAGPTGGVPSTIPNPNPHFWEENQNGVILTTPSPSFAGLTRLQFSPDGSGVIPYNPGADYVPGVNCAVPFCNGGDGYPYSLLASLESGVENYLGTMMGHYDVTDHLTISVQLTAARNIGSDPLGEQATGPAGLSVLNGNAFAFTNSNPYLNASQIAALTAVDPAFATGGTLYMSKIFQDLPYSYWVQYITDTLRGIVTASGDFDVGSHNLDYSVTYSRANVNNVQNSWGIDYQRFLNAVNGAKNSSGQIVCAINAVTVTDPNCVPINPFGAVTPAAQAYINLPNGPSGLNTQDDLVGTIGGTVVPLPAGPMKFSVTYEHRAETESNVNASGTVLGIFTTNGVGSPSTYGSYHTDEYAGELLVPVLSDKFNIPFITKVDLNGQYRRVDNSLAGTEDVWGFGGTMETDGGFAFRGSHSRNFRAPTLTELIAPQTTTLAGGISDPCDARYIAAGSVPATRQAACLALFQANPTWGLNSIANLPAGSSAAARLANFQDPAVNFSTALVTTGGNPNLQNEVALNTTFGVTWQPTFAPGFTLGFDRIAIDIANGLTAFTPTNFTQTCADSGNAAAACGTFKRDPTTGYVTSALNTTFNAASVTYRGELYTIDYHFGVASLFNSERDDGQLDFQLQATHNETLTTIVDGAITRQAGTTVEPWWVVRGDIHYTYGPLRINYEIYYLPPSKVNRFDTIESTPFPTVNSNTRHSVSATYTWRNYQFRAGIDNILNTGPSFSTIYNYGDIIGRSFFAGVNAKF